MKVAGTSVINKTINVNFNLIDSANSASNIHLNKSVWDNSISSYANKLKSKFRVFVKDTPASVYKEASIIQINIPSYNEVAYKEIEIHEFKIVTSENLENKIIKIKYMDDDGEQLICS